MNVKNELIKHRFLEHLQYAQGRSTATIREYEKAIHYYELCFEDEDFVKFNKEKAIAIKSFLSEKGLASVTVRAALNHIKSLFTWLKEQKGFKQKINKDDIEYLNAGKKENTLATQATYKEYPTLEYTLKLVSSIKGETEVDYRNKALISFIACTGMRDSAVRTLPFGAVNIKKHYVTQDPRLGVDTKYSKIGYSKIFNFHPHLIQVIDGWYDLLTKKSFKDVDPFFPFSKHRRASEGISIDHPIEVDRAFWTNSNNIRRIFTNVANVAGLKYFNPHSFRHSAIFIALQAVTNGLELKALSQNFSHEEVITTMLNYANLPPDRVLEILDRMQFKFGQKYPENGDIDLAMKIISLIRQPY